jgi:hypothetical protein
MILSGLTLLSQIGLERAYLSLFVKLLHVWPQEKKATNQIGMQYYYIIHTITRVGAIKGHFGCGLAQSFFGRCAVKTLIQKK